MPLPVESLSKESSDDAAKEAIRRSIAKCIDEGKDSKQCAAIAYDIARKQTGRDIK